RCASFSMRHGGRRRLVDRLVAVRWIYLQEAADADRTTVVEAHELGWFYSVRVPGSGRVVLFFTDGDLEIVRRLGRASEFEMLVLQTKLVANILHRTKAARHGQRQVVSATSSCLESATGEGWIAVGDAAASLDPLSSLGI